MKPHGRPEPRFDIDLDYGRQGEYHVADLLTWMADGSGTVEVKRKRVIDLEFYIETACDKGRTGHFAPSGISVTTAAAWAFVIADTGITLIVPTDDLRVAINHPSARNVVTANGSCPTRGRLLNLGVLLYLHKQKAAHS